MARSSRQIIDFPLVTRRRADVGPTCRPDLTAAAITLITTLGKSTPGTTLPAPWAGGWPSHEDGYSVKPAMYGWYRKTRLRRFPVVSVTKPRSTSFSVRELAAFPPL